MGLLDALLGSARLDQHKDFVKKYENGPATEGYSGQEAMRQYQEVAPNLSRDQYMQAALQSFSRLSPQQRAAFAQYLQQQAQNQSVNLPFMNQQPNPAQVEDPRYLAQMATQVHEQDPGLLAQLFGGGGNSGNAGGILSNPIAKAALAGIAAMAVKNVLGQRQ